MDKLWALNCGLSSVNESQHTLEQLSLLIKFYHLTHFVVETEHALEKVALSYQNLLVTIQHATVESAYSEISLLISLLK